VNEDAGWPVVADLTQPVVSESGAIDYNGFFGVLSGETIVQGKFSVLAGNTPAIGVVVGAIALISSGSCLFRFHGGSRIIPLKCGRTSGNRSVSIPANPCGHSRCPKLTNS